MNCKYILTRFKRQALENLIYFKNAYPCHKLLWRRSLCWLHAEIIILYHHLGNKIFLIKTTVSVFVNDLGREGENQIQLGLKVFFFFFFFNFLIFFFLNSASFSWTPFQTQAVGSWERLGLWTLNLIEYPFVTYLPVKVWILVKSKPSHSWIWVELARATLTPCSRTSSGVHPWGPSSPSPERELRIPASKCPSGLMSLDKGQNLSPTPRFECGGSRGSHTQVPPLPTSWAGRHGSSLTLLCSVEPGCGTSETLWTQHY